MRKEIQEITEKMKVMSIPTDPKTTATAIVIGGLTKFSLLDEASKWLGDILWNAYAPQPIGTYVKRKDAEFKGIFCANFSSPADRIKSLNILKAKLVELGENEIWTDTDLPAHVRAPEKILFKLKKQLLAWGFGEKSVYVDVESSSNKLKVEGKPVLVVTCAENQLVCEWEDAWQKWDDLQNSAELKSIFEKAQDILSGGGKGKSKGKPH